MRRKKESPRPELHCRRTESHYEDENLFDMSDSLKDIIRDDDVEKFVPCMMEEFPCPQNGYGSLKAVEKDAQQPTYCPKAVISFVFIHHAVNCATALLEGETGLTMDPNHPCSLGRYPLHDAASAMSYDLVDLLLRHGAQADVRTIEVKPYTRGGLLPLSVAVEHFRLHRYLLAWTPEQSIVKLIIIFCLPQMKAPLEVCKLLALSTVDVIEVFNGYCMDGKLFEVIALLMVAWEKLIDTVNGRLLIRDSIMVEIHRLDMDILKLSLWGSSTRACKSKRMNLENMATVLEIFEKVGVAIGTYVQLVHCHVTRTSKEDVVNKVKKLLVESGYFLIRQDTNLSDIDCEDGSIKLASQILDSKLRPLQQCSSLVGGSNVAVEVPHSKKKDWAIRGFFANIPILRHGQDMSRRNLLLHRPVHDVPLPLLSSPSMRGYVSIASIVKKGLRYLR